MILLAASLILFFGFFAEFIFKRFGVPDILFLIILGFLIGPFVFNYVTPDKVMGVAPVFTTFTLVFLLFDGAFKIRLSALIKEFSKSFLLTTYNFFISTAVVAVVMAISGFFLWHEGVPIKIALLTGFLLGGVSSAFVIPTLKQLKVSDKLYSLLTLEGALTDVFCIVFSLTVIKIFQLNQIGVQTSAIQLVQLFAVAGMVGLVGGILWIVMILHVFREHNYIMTIAYLFFIYVIAEFLKGSGALAALFFGLMLNNSKQLSSIIQGITARGRKERKEALEGELGVSVTTPTERTFYDQISRFLKIFFFVYIGLLIDVANTWALILGVGISFLLMFSRTASKLLTKGMDPANKGLVNSMFARGLAAAAVAQLALEAGIPHADFITSVASVAITGTIILSSVRILFIKKYFLRKVKKIKPLGEAKLAKIKKLEKNHKENIKKGTRKTKKR